MTAIACWISKERNSTPRIWAVGDSLISAPHADGRGVLTEFGTKLFALPMVRRAADERGDFTLASGLRTFGMAYAGSSVVGLNLAPALSLILTNLIGRSDAPLPSLQEVADFSGSLLRRFILRYGSHLNLASRADPGCHAALFGFCPREQECLVFHLRPNITATEVTVEVVRQPSEDDAVLVIGGAVEKITERIREFRKHRLKGSSVWWQAPLYVLKDCVDKEEFPGIGGHLQAGIADERGFRPQAIFEPFKGEEVQISKTFLGLELFDDLGSIGDHLVNMESIPVQGGLVGVKYMESDPESDPSADASPDPQ